MKLVRSSTDLEKTRLEADRRFEDEKSPDPERELKYLCVWIFAICGELLGEEVEAEGEKASFRTAWVCLFRPPRIDLRLEGFAFAFDGAVVSCCFSCNGLLDVDRGERALSGGLSWRIGVEGLC